MPCLLEEPPLHYTLQVLIQLAITQAPAAVLAIAYIDSPSWEAEVAAANAAATAAPSTGVTTSNTTTTTTTAMSVRPEAEAPAPKLRRVDTQTLPLCALWRSQRAAQGLSPHLLHLFSFTRTPAVDAFVCDLMGSAGAVGVARAAAGLCPLGHPTVVAPPVVYEDVCCMWDQARFALPPTTPSPTARTHPCVARRFHPPRPAPPPAPTRV